MVEVLLLKVSCWHVVVGIHKCKHVLEHTTCCTTSGHEFHNSLTLGLVLFPCFLQLLTLIGIRCNNTIADTCSSLQLQKWEASLELIQLILNLLLGYTFLSNLFQIFFVHHNINRYLDNLCRKGTKKT